MFKIKLTNSNMLNSVMTLIFPAFDGKYPVWANLVCWTMIVCWRWDLVPRLGRSCLILLDQKYVFWAYLFLKGKIDWLRWNLVSGRNQICWISWWCSLALFWTWNTLFRQTWSETSKFYIYGYAEGFWQF